MFKRVLSVLAGVATGLAIVMATDTLIGKLYPPPPGIDYHNSEAVKQMVSNMPVGAFLVLLTGYAIAAFAGGAVATLVSGRARNVPALITGGILMVGGIMNVAEIPGHPIWFIVASTLAYIPFAYVGYIITKGKTTST
jgi:hypothetical protein